MESSRSGAQEQNERKQHLVGENQIFSFIKQEFFVLSTSLPSLDHNESSFAGVSMLALA